MSNKKGNMYDWAKTYNPLAGECPHKCGYCSTNKLKRFPVVREKYTGVVRIDRPLFNKPLCRGKKVFVCAQHDLFAEGISTTYVMEILTKCRAYDNNYFFQTKNPTGFYRYLENMPEKTILCTTIETNRIYPQMGNTPSPTDRAIAMSCIHNFDKEITIEPIMSFDLKEMVYYIKMIEPQAVHIGADSKNNHLQEPSKDEILELIKELKKLTEVNLKTNLNRLLI